MKEKSNITPPSKGKPTDAFGNGNTKEKSFEEGLSETLRKLGNKTGELKPQEKEEYKVDNATENLAKKLDIEKRYVEDAYQNDSKELVKMSDAFNKADNKTEGFAIAGVFTSTLSLLSGMVFMMDKIHYNELSPIALGLSILGAGGTTLAFKKVSQSAKERKKLTSKVRARLTSRLEFIQNKQLPPPK